MQNKFRMRHLWYLVLLTCLLLGSSQAGLVSAEQDVWPANEIIGSPLAVQPIGTFIPIATNDTIYEYAPAVAHGGQHYVVIYLSGDGHVYASVRNNDGTLVSNFIVDNSHNFFSPRIAYNHPFGLFVITYHYVDSSGVYHTRVKTFSPSDGIVGDFYSFEDASNPDIACSQEVNTCLLAYSHGLTNPIYGHYLSLGPEGFVSKTARRFLSTGNGRVPYLALGSGGTSRYLLTFTFTHEGVDYPVYNHLFDSPTAGDNSYVSPTQFVLDDWTAFPNNKIARGVAYDPCTEHFLVLFDHDISGNQSQINIWAAAIHKLNKATNWSGPVANRTHSERSGGISFVTDANLPASCGVMNKLAVIYTNLSENRIYALELRGNNNKTTPVYTRDEIDDHFLVADLGVGQTYKMPQISSGSRDGEMFLVFDVEYTTASNVWGRLVHVWEPEEVSFNKMLPEDGAVDQPLRPSLSWQSVDNAERYEYCLGTINGTCNVRDWTSTGTRTNVLFDAEPSTTYFWQVRVVSAVGITYANDNTWWSFTTEVTSLSPFNKISPLNGANVRINPSLVWEESSNADNYEYCYAETNSCSRWNDNGTDTSTTLNDLEYNTTYYWQVRANKDGNTIYANGSESKFWSFTTPSAGDPITAGFSASPTSGPAPLRVTFTDESTGDYSTCTWHFGDGTTRSRCGDPVHTYQEAGDYTVQLTISGPGGEDTITIRNYISVSDPITPLPGAFNKTSPRNGATNHTINPTLEWEQSRGAVSYQYCLAETESCSRWTDNGTATSVVLTGLDSNKTYYWQVRAINDGGTTDANDGTWWSFTTAAAGDPVSAHFSASPTSGPAPLIVIFTDESTGDYNTCTWDFGDGSTSSRCGNPVHTYQAAGIYTVQLTISGRGGEDTITRRNYISATDPTTPVPGAFNKTSPRNGAINLTINPTLVWEQSRGAVSYQYCLAETASCSRWINNDDATSIALPGLDSNTTYYWQVRAINVGGTTDANDGTWWTFTTAAAGDPVSAHFSAFSTSGPAPLIVTFIDESTGDYDTCTWDFGDGSTSTRCRNPVHTYQVAGVYTVKLTISGGGGEDTLTRRNYITVSDIGHTIFLPLIQR